MMAKRTRAAQISFCCVGVNVIMLLLFQPAVFSFTAQKPSKM